MNKKAKKYLVSFPDRAFNDGDQYFSHNNDLHPSLTIFNVDTSLTYVDEKDLIYPVEIKEVFDFIGDEYYKKDDDDIYISNKSWLPKRSGILPSQQGAAGEDQTV